MDMLGIVKCGGKSYYIIKTQELEKTNLQSPPSPTSLGSTGTASPTPSLDSNLSIDSVDGSSYSDIQNDILIKCEPNNGNDDDILRSLRVDPTSLTPYSDATQVGHSKFKPIQFILKIKNTRFKYLTHSVMRVRLSFLILKKIS